MAAIDGCGIMRKAEAASRQKMSDAISASSCDWRRSVGVCSMRQNAGSRETISETMVFAGVPMRLSRADFREFGWLGAWGGGLSRMHHRARISWIFGLG